MNEQARQRDQRARNRDLRRIRAIWKRIAACESFFLSPSDLQRLGVEARQVENTDDGDPRFEPRFFEPHPAAGVLQQYPIDPAAPSSKQRMEMPLWGIPTLQEALATVQENFPNSEDPLKAARDMLFAFITSELDARRKGGPPGLTLRNFETVKQFIDFDESLMQQGGLSPVVWKHHIFREEWDYICPLPHAFCTIEARVDGTLSDQNITIHEMRAIMRMIRIRFRGSRRDTILQALELRGQGYCAGGTFHSLQTQSICRDLRGQRGIQYDSGSPVRSTISLELTDHGWYDLVTTSHSSWIFPVREASDVVPICSLNHA